MASTHHWSIAALVLLVGDATMRQVWPSLWHAAAGTTPQQAADGGCSWPKPSSCASRKPCGPSRSRGGLLSSVLRAWPLAVLTTTHHGVASYPYSWSWTTLPATADTCMLQLSWLGSGTSSEASLLASTDAYNLSTHARHVHVDSAV